jgi:hypothetical protein
MSALSLPIRAATETAVAHGIRPDRCDVLQDGSTLVLRLTETLVARVLQDRDGPRTGTAWFARENAIAQHLTEAGAPVIPLHPGLPPGPHEHLGYPMNFWEYVTRIDDPPEPAAIGRTLRHCHEILRTFPDTLPQLAILTETLDILQQRSLFPADTQAMLQSHLRATVRALEPAPRQALHGDAFPGNFIHTTRGLLWTDWEDTFSGPVEWDLASALWNAQFLEHDTVTVASIRQAYGPVNDDLLQQCFIGRAAVMTAWYPILYPNPDAERSAKLDARLAWLRQN